MQELKIRNRDNKNIVITIEKANNQRGLAFVMHGLSGFKEQEQIKTFAKVFIDNNYTVITFDTRNTFSDSEGNFEDATITNYYEDLEDVIKWASKEDFYQEPFVLAGHSVGGMSISLFAEKYPEKIKGLAPISAVISGEHIFETWGEERMNQWKETGWDIEISSSRSGVIKKLKYDFVEDAKRYSLIDNIDNLKMPVLLMVGEKDECTPPSHQKMFFVFFFCFPDFVALPATISKRLFLDKKFRDQVVNEIIKNTQYKSYAVRSSALIEDGKNESLAGKFLTKINITKNKLEYAVYEVLKQAEARGDLKKFSVIIQKYILPNISGVTFTRDPKGGREMVVEYAYCTGEKIVGGETKPRRISFYWHDIFPKDLPEEFIANNIIEKFKKIEKEYEFPQDIEWCIRDNKFYLLQTRPISTISDKQYEQIIFLEKNFSQKEKYYFAKTEVSETSPRPTNFTFDILRSIYMENGPVDRVYKKYGIDYQNTDFLKIIGNELYVDKEKEIISLLPAYTYFKNKYFLPRFSRFSRSLATIKNLFFLNMIRGVNHKILFNKLKIKIEDNQSITDLRTAIKNFLIDYELVFEINLLSGISIKRLESMIKKEPFSFLKIIGSNSIFSVSDKYNMQIPAGLKGNSLDMIDESEFVAAYNDEKKEDRELIVWWNSVPDYKKYFLKDKIKGVVIFHP